MRLFLAALALAGAMTAARANDDPMAFARAGMGVPAVERVILPLVHSAHVGEPLRLSGAIPDMITQAFCAHAMCGFAPTMVRIAKIESGLRCSPGGNGGGMFQFIRGTRRSLGLTNPTSCVANIAAAVRYAARGIAHGVRTGAQMGSWWNSGYVNTERRHLERAYRVARL